MSVILPTYNRQVWVCNAIDSVLAQRCPPDEIVVVDDGSTDRTAAVLKSYGSAIRVITQPNRGVAAARNTGWMHSQGEWIAFIDSDDEWHPRYLETQQQALASVPQAVLSITNARLIGHGHSEASYFELNGLHHRWGPFDQCSVAQSEAMALMVRHLPWQLGAAVVKRQAFEQAGRFDERLRLSEDVEWLARVARQGPVVLTNQPLLEVHRRQGERDGLSDAQVLSEMQARLLNDQAYRRWLALDHLSWKERCAIRKRISANGVSLAHVLAGTDDGSGARHWYGRSLRTWPSAAALVGWMRARQAGYKAMHPAVAAQRRSD